VTGSSPAVDTTAIAQGLSNPLGVYAESGCTSTVRPPRLVLAVRTDTAFALPLAAIFTEALRTRLPLEPATADAIELSLHEALANAIIHGNLHLSSEGRDSPHVYGNFCAELTARLQDPVAAARMVHVAARWTKTRLSLAVTDQGRGFILPKPLESAEAKHGRGLNIVRACAASVTWNQRRRRLMFVFDIKGGTAP
jgi:anti-sigma regulatory factor (Ser/Thr protein kinase)